MNFALGFVSGLFPGALAGYVIYRSLLIRIRWIQNSEILRLELQKRRETTDSGRDYPPVAGAGPQGNVSYLFSRRPGALELEHIRETNAKKLTERLD